MSREVELKNIQMTATTPEDTQISLGALGADNSAASTSLGAGYSLAGNTGVLVKASGTNADDCNVLAPQHDWDWSNVADIANYYQIGKLIPASSTNGTNIYFTPDANGVGKTVRSDATFIQADGGTPGGAGATQSGSGADTTKTFKTTLHAKTTSSDNWNTATYSPSTGWNTTNDDGYYVDIPVWLRTSSRSGAVMNVEAYVIPKTTTQTLNSDNEALYRAVRVAILDTTQADSAPSISPTGLLPVADGMNGISSSSAGSLATSPFSGDSILNWYNGTGTNGATGTATNVAVKATGTLTGTVYNSTIYGPVTVYDKTTPQTLVTLAAGEGTSYGKPTKMIVRVWLEGEDRDCWNATAGQDWSINLKFNNGTSNDHDDIKGTATSAAATTTDVTATVADDGSGGLAVSYGTMPTGTITKYTYDGNDYDSLGALETALTTAGVGSYTVTVSYIA